MQLRDTFNKLHSSINWEMYGTEDEEGILLNSSTKFFSSFFFSKERQHMLEPVADIISSKLLNNDIFNVLCDMNINM